MEAKSPTRQEAWELLREYNSSETAIKHALTVEAVMRYMADRRGEDADKWGVIGLVHDLDYERFPDQHCAKTREILSERGWAEDYIRAVVSHGWGLCSDVEPQSEMEKVLYAIDELTGLITACVLVRPSRSVLDLNVKSVRKKWKDKRFAAGVNRGVIEKGAEMLGVEVSDLVAEVIDAMRANSRQLGLEGEVGD